MLEKKITFVDYNGNERTETHYFYLNESELMKWLTTNGEYTLDKLLMRLYQEGNGRKIMDIFEDLIRKSYGKRSLDGRKFEKSKEIWDDFYQTEAYSKLFMEIVTDAKKASEFVNGIIPSNLAVEVDKVLKEHPDAIPDEMKDYIGEVKSV